MGECVYACMCVCVYSFSDDMGLSSIPSLRSVGRGTSVRSKVKPSVHQLATLDNMFALAFLMIVGRELQSFLLRLERGEHVFAIQVSSFHFALYLFAGCDEAMDEDESSIQQVNVPCDNGCARGPVWSTHAFWDDDIPEDPEVIATCKVRVDPIVFMLYVEYICSSLGAESV